MTGELRPETIEKIKVVLRALDELQDADWPVVAIGSARARREMCEVAFEIGLDAESDVELS